MRGTTIVIACCLALAPGCGRSSSSKGRDGGVAGAISNGGAVGTGVGGALGPGGGLGTGGVLGTGGSLGTGGLVGSAGQTQVSGTGGLVGTGGAVDTGGAIHTDGGFVDAGHDAPASALDGETRDVAIGSDGTRDLPGVEAAALPTCAAAGGVCSTYRWVLCPAHFEPIGLGDGHLDCRSDGWCCVAAPPSPCSDESAGNCVPGDACTHCWRAAPGSPACESGRVCCLDNCW
jgi:hypothetical protein